MGFRTVYGYSISENGWRMCDSNELDRAPVPGTNVVIPLRRGDPHTILTGFAARVHRELEQLDQSQCGGWTGTNDVGNSNHLAGTATDLNWRRHPFRRRGTWGNKLGGLRAILADFRGCVWYGGDWQSPIDEMHFQLNFPEGDGRIKALGNDLRGGLFGIFKPGAQPPVYVPPAGGVGGDGILRVGSEGPAVAKLQSEMNRIFPRYSRLAVDGDFGPLTDAVVREFQHRAGIVVDGEVGPQTRATLAKYGVKL